MEATERLGSRPARSAWTHFRRLWRFGLLERRFLGRGTLEYRITDLGRLRLRWLRSQLLAVTVGSNPLLLIAAPTLCSRVCWLLGGATFAFACGDGGGIVPDITMLTIESRPFYITRLSGGITH